MGFPDSSVGKEATCNEGDPSSIPELGRSAGEGIDYPPQYSGLENSMFCIEHGVAKSQSRLRDFHFSWTSLVAQTVKNPSAMQETRVRSLGWEDPLEEGMATHSSILAWRILMDRGAWWATVHGVEKSQTGLSN